MKDFFKNYLFILIYIIFLMEVTSSLASQEKEDLLKKDEMFHLNFTGQQKEQADQRVEEIGISDTSKSFSNIVTNSHLISNKEETEDKILREDVDPFDMSKISNALPSFHEESFIYNVDSEYECHQKVSERFFRRITRKLELRKKITTFCEELRQKNNNPQKLLTPINLDGLSSRTRILLFRELTAYALGQEISLPFTFHGKDFNINLKPSLRQPGDGIIDKIGTHENIFDVLSIYTSEYQKIISKKLLSARCQKPYHQTILYPIICKENITIDLEILNILLDFEVARRLQGTYEQELKSYFLRKTWVNYVKTVVEGQKQTEYYKYFLDWIRFLIDGIRISHSRNLECARKLYNNYDKKIELIKDDKNQLDSVPIASAIVGIMKLSTNDEIIPLKLFFNAPSTFKKGDSTFKHGPLHAFQGAPSEQHRDKAVKAIIENLRKGKKVNIFSCEEIHQEYLEIFKGDSESDGESYDIDEYENCQNYHLPNDIHF